MILNPANTGHDGRVAESPERRGGDRRGTIDLTWPGYNERRTPGSGRRDVDAELAAKIEALPRVDLPAPMLSDGELLVKSADELRADYDRLSAALQARAANLQGLTDEEFQQVQVRDQPALVAAAAYLKQLERAIVSGGR